MLVLRGTPEQLAAIQQRPQRGLLAWLYSDGVLLIPDDLQPPDNGDDTFLRELEQALAQPLEPFPIEVAPPHRPRWHWPRPRWWRW